MGRHLPHRLLAVGLMIAAAWAPTADGQDNGADTGPCGESTPCTPGQLLGDPNDCGIYHKCDGTGSVFVQQTCAEGYQFDFRKLKCKDPESAAKIRCSPSCQKLARLDAGVEPSPPSTLPKAGEQPSVQTNPTQTTPRVPGPITAVVVPVVAAADADNATQIATTTTTTTTIPTTETTSAKMETTQQQTTASTVAKTAPPVVIIPSKTPEPPYVIVTEPRDDVTAGGGGQEGGRDDVTVSPDTGSAGISPIIIGAVIGGVIVIVIIIIIVILLLKRRKFSKRRDIERIENPQYAAPSNAKYRFSRDSTLYVGPTVNLRQTNNNTSLDTSGVNSVERKKKQAPVAPSHAKKDKSNKRKAPPPPNPFTGEVEDYDRPVTDLYDKDSQGSDDNLEMSTFTAQNENTSSAEKDEDKVPVVTDPLLEKNSTGDDPVLGNGQADIKDIDDDGDNNSDEDYDKANNPFFDD